MPTKFVRTYSIKFADQIAKDIEERHKNHPSPKKGYVTGEAHEEWMRRSASTTEAAET